MDTLIRKRVAQKTIATYLALSTPAKFVLIQVSKTPSTPRASLSLRNVLKDLYSYIVISNV